MSSAAKEREARLKRWRAIANRIVQVLENETNRDVNASIKALALVIAAFVRLVPVEERADFIDAFGEDIKQMTLHDHHISPDNTLQ